MPPPIPVQLSTGLSYQINHDRKETGIITIDTSTPWQNTVDRENNWIVWIIEIEKINFDTVEGN